MQTGIQNKKNAGVTLIELCLAGVILSGLFIISWPTLNRTARQARLQSVCKNIYSTFNFARERSLVEGRHFRIEFDKFKKVYNLESENDPINKPGEFQSYTRSSIKQFNWHDDIEIQEISDKQIIFNPDGTTSDFYIVFENLQKDKCGIKVKGISGRCKIE